jgi:hypothetical protein
MKERKSSAKTTGATGVRVEGHTDSIEVDGMTVSGWEDSKLFDVDSAGSLDVQNVREEDPTVPGRSEAHVNRMRIGSNTFRDASMSHGPRSDPGSHLEPQRRLRGKSTALIPELPWKRDRK